MPNSAMLKVSWAWASAEAERGLHRRDHRKEQVHRERRDQRGEAERRARTARPGVRLVRFHRDAHANCGNSRSALPRSMAARCAGEIASSAS